MRVYLAGPISGLTYEGCTDWREFAQEELSKFDIEGVSPMRSKSILKKYATIADEYPKHVLSTAKGITHRDMWDVRRCDIVLVNFVGAESVSIGTVLEIGAAYALSKPIVLCMEKGNIHRHAMVSTMCGWELDTLEKGIDTVLSLR